MQVLENKRFDYIVVGAGSAGATLAARLSENPENHVCLLEAGGKDSSPFIHIPFGLAAIARLKGINWNYNTAPQKELNNREMYWPRGKTLGGSSSINAMCYIRGAQADYDKWHKLGAEGWNWNSVLPYFKKSQNQERGANEYHGVDGPLAVSDLRHVSPLSEKFVKTAESVGVPELDDFNGERTEGLGFYQVTQRGGKRCSSAKGYLSSIDGRRNLTVLTQAMAQKVLIEDGTAKGVLINYRGEDVELLARKEVLLSGGAINSPQLLMLSGIGPEDHLREVGVNSLVDLPGVGQNLQDHLDAIVQHRTNRAEGYAFAVRSIPSYLKAGFDYVAGRKGMLSSNIAEAGGFVKTKYANGLADIQYHFLPAILHDHGRKTVYGYGYGLHVCCLYPKSRGEIKLNSNDWREAPYIDPRYLTHPEDQKVMIEGVKMAREILGDKEFDEYNAREILPGDSIKSDEDILKFIRARAETIYHPVGTCKMGKMDDPMSVVTPDLKVKNVAGLRVVDASVMPTLIGGNTNAPAIMIAEKAADMIQQGK